VEEQPAERRNLAPILSTREPENSLSMGYEHLSITPETESDEFTKSNAKNLLPIPSECEVTSEDKRECDELVYDNHSDTFSDFKIDDDISVYNDDLSSDDESFKDIEYVDASVPNLAIVSVEEENVVQREEEEVDLEDISHVQDERLINLVENDNSDSSNDPLFEEVDLFLFDDSIPPGIENVADDLEEDIYFLEELLINDSIFSHDSFDSSFEDSPLIPRPRPKPSDDNFDLEPEVEAKPLPTNDARVVVKFLKSLFSRFGTPKAIISDRGTHFCNDQFSRVMAKYGVTHRLSIAYHPQTSGQVEVTNCGLKRILERTVEENRASWSDKLEDALWAFRTAFKTLVSCTPYRLVYGKACHLPLELEHKAYWALKHANFNLKTAGDHRKLQLNELNELRDQAYENSLIYKELTKKLHDDKIKNRIFNVGDQVLLFTSRLKIFLGKLKSRWFGPFTISEIYPCGTANLIHPDGCNFKVNCHRLKHYHRGDPPPLEIPDVTTFPKDN
nr:reverse transcriptase domain-containing protein [Tanacetum cinerariifolium]